LIKNANGHIEAGPMPDLPIHQNPDLVADLLIFGTKIKSDEWPKFSRH
jgi:hypothetical protein